MAYQIEIVPSHYGKDNIAISGVASGLTLVKSIDEWIDLANEVLTAVYKTSQRYTAIDALMDMCGSYLTHKDGTMRHDFMSAGENALEQLQRMGLVKEVGNERYIEVTSFKELK
jgi:hypothetical protein